MWSLPYTKQEGTFLLYVRSFGFIQGPKFHIFSAKQHTSRSLNACFVTQKYSFDVNGFPGYLTTVFQLKEHWANVQSCLVRANNFNCFCPLPNGVNRFLCFTQIWYAAPFHNSSTSSYSTDCLTKNFYGVNVYTMTILRSQSSLIHTYLLKARIYTGAV
jgi:hypothetical protein